MNRFFSVSLAALFMLTLSAQTPAEAKNDKGFKFTTKVEVPISILRIFSFFRREFFPFQTFSATVRASFPVIRIMEMAPPGAVHSAAAVSSLAESFFEKIVIIFRLSLEKNPVEIIIMRIILAHKT